MLLYPFPSRILHVFHTSNLHSTYVILLGFITLIVDEREFGLNYKSRRESVVDFCQQGNEISDFKKSEEIIYYLNGYKLPQKSTMWGLVRHAICHNSIFSRHHTNIKANEYLQWRLIKEMKYISSNLASRTPTRLSLEEQILV